MQHAATQKTEWGHALCHRPMPETRQSGGLRQSLGSIDCPQSTSYG